MAAGTVYNASKSFVQSFAEALHHELRDSGVTVTSLMSGPPDSVKAAANRWIVGRIASH